MKKTRKIIKKISSLMDSVIQIIFCIVFLIGVYGIYDTWAVFNKAQDKSTLQYKPKDGKVLGQELKNNVAWITLDDSQIEYPVMQGITNNDYLNVDPYGNYSLSGSIFLDSRNNDDFTDGYNLVYGHHMSDNAMFGALDQWKDEKFYNSHLKGTLTTTCSIYELNVIGFAEIDASQDEIFQPGTIPAEQSVNYINSMFKSNSDHILALSTCKQPQSTLRTILFCNMTLKYEGKQSVNKQETDQLKDNESQVGGKVYTNVQPVTPNKTWLDSLLCFIGIK